VFTLSVVFSHLPEQHVIGDLRLFLSNMLPHSFSKRKLTTLSFMLDEEEKNVTLSDKKKRMWVHKCIRSWKSEGSFVRNTDGGIFAHSKLGEYLETHLGIPEGKQLPGTSCFDPHIIVGDEAFPLETYLMRPYPGSQSKRENEKSIFNYRLSRIRRKVENAFRILSQEFKIYQRTPTIIAGECGQH